MTAGEKNSVQLILADAKDKPVTDLGNTLKVEGHHRLGRAP